MRTPIEALIGRRVAEARRIAGWTQADLAERCDLSPQTVGRLERGEQMPPLGRLEHLAETLGTTLPELVERREAGGRQERMVAKVTKRLRRASLADVELVAGIVELVLRTR